MTCELGDSGLDLDPWGPKALRRYDGLHIKVPLPLSRPELLSSASKSCPSRGSPPRCRSSDTMVSAPHWGLGTASPGDLPGAVFTRLSNRDAAPSRNGRGGATPWEHPNRASRTDKVSRPGGCFIRDSPDLAYTHRSTRKWATETSANGFRHPSCASPADNRARLSRCEMEGSGITPAGSKTTQPSDGQGGANDPNRPWLVCNA